MRIDGNEHLKPTAARGTAPPVQGRHIAEINEPSAPKDGVLLQGSGKKEWDPGNIPIALRKAASTSGADAGGSAQVLPGSLSVLEDLDTISNGALDFPRGVFIEKFDLDDISPDDYTPQEISDYASRNTKKMPSVTFIYDARAVPHVENLKLKGSFNPATGQYDPSWNKGAGIPMFDDGTHGDEKAGDGRYTAQVALDPGDPHTFQWGVTGDVRERKDGALRAKDKWLIMTEEPPSFKVSAKGGTEYYTPLSNHLMGVHKVGEDGVSFRTWSPEVGKGEYRDFRLFVDIYDDEKGGVPQSLPMTKDERTGNWSLELPTGWKELEGRSYQYAVRNSANETLSVKVGAANRGPTPIVYSDPYARYLQGQQRGLERIYVDPILGAETGWYDASGSGGPNYMDNQQWARFTVNDNPEADKVILVMRDEKGKQLTRDELLQRIGAPSLVPYDKASPSDRRDVDILKNWKIDTSARVTDYQWTDGLREDGSIEMKKVGGGTLGTSWVSTVNNFPALVGLRYEFQVYEKGRLKGDLNRDGELQDGERKLTPFNDSFGNVISARPGGERRSVIRESSFVFQHDDAPRKETDFRKYVIYEAHVGSFMGTKDNARPCTFQDLANHLDYLEKLGVNTIEIMPINEFGGRRDWGYTPDFYFAGADTYGFEMPREKAESLGLIRPDQELGKESVWIGGTDAVKYFVDEAHRRGFGVMSDVVYNHTSGKADADNPLWLIDGDKKSFFKWGDHMSETPWGTKPNYGAQAVKDFYANNGAQQVEEFHFDGIRFDFTQVLHDTGDDHEKREGMNALRQVNRTLQFIRPGVLTYTVAEDFTNNWLVAADLDKSEWQGSIEKKGMGFSAVWNASFHHDLLGAVEGTNPEKNMDRLMESILSHKGVSGWDRAVVFSHNHDEVGNTGSWIGRAAARSRDDKDVLKPYPRAVARSAAAVTLTAAGVPMIFQGEEFLANNDFKHGITSTWGADLRWLDFDVNPARLDEFNRISALPASKKEKEVEKLPEKLKGLFARYERMTPEEKAQAEVLSDRAGIFESYRDLVALRGKSEAFIADAPIQRIFTHNADRVMAFERKGGGDDFVVITNFADVERPGYKVTLPPGKWKEVFNTNARSYGGSGTGNGGSTMAHDQGVYLPAGSTIILKRV